MPKNTRASRSGFTLLEVVLALGIALVLLGALYWSMSSQLRLAQGGRNMIEKGTLARSLLTRISNDITAHLGPVSSFSGNASGAASASGTSGSNSSTPATTGNGMSQPSSQPAMDSYGPFNLGVQGFDGATSQVLSLTVSKYTRELSQNKDQAPVVSDLRRIDYWLVQDGEKSGLARREIKVATSTDTNDQNFDPTTLPEQSQYIVAPEVKNLTFQYWDGSTWVNTWDGRTQGTDPNYTPLGPPAAIAIIIEFAPPAGSAADTKGPVFRHVVNIPTANNPTQQ